MPNFRFKLLFTYSLFQRQQQRNLRSTNVHVDKVASELVKRAVLPAFLLPGRDAGTSGKGSVEVSFKLSSAVLFLTRNDLGIVKKVGRITNLVSLKSGVVRAV